MKFSALSIGAILLTIFFSMILVAGCSFVVPPTPTVEPSIQLPIETQALVPTKTSTPAPTYTLVIQPGTPLPSLGEFVPTLTPTIPYNLPGITPVVPVMKNPIGFASPFKVVTYPVTGTTVNQLSVSLDKNALKDPHDLLGRHFAMTAWYLSASWDEKPSIAGCELARANITMTITMTLPALTNPSSLPADVEKRWDNFITNTITHEMGHVKLNVDGATEYRRILGNYLPAMDCALLKKQLNDLFQRQFSQIDKANLDYDNQTQHGATQGAVFP